MASRERGSDGGAANQKSPSYYVTHAQRSHRGTAEVNGSDGSDSPNTEFDTEETGEQRHEHGASTTGDRLDPLVTDRTGWYHSSVQSGQ
jgi:hypothetical protein